MLSARPSAAVMPPTIGAVRRIYQHRGLRYTGLLEHACAPGSTMRKTAPIALADITIPTSRSASLPPGYAALYADCADESATTEFRHHRDGAVRVS